MVPLFWCFTSLQCSSLNFQVSKFSLDLVTTKKCLSLCNLTITNTSWQPFNLSHLSKHFSFHSLECQDFPSFLLNSFFSLSKSDVLLCFLSSTEVGNLGFERLESVGHDGEPEEGAGTGKKGGGDEVVGGVYCLSS